MTIVNTATAEHTDTEVQLDVLIRARVIAKREEDAAIERRRECDTAILDMLPKLSATTRVGDVKVITSYGVSRKVDSEKLTQHYAANTVPAALSGLFRWKAEVNEAAFKLLAPDTKLLAAAYVATTDAKPSLKLELA